MKASLLLKINNSIIIGPNEFRDYFLIEKTRNKLNYKYTTKEDVLHSIFGVYNDLAIRSLMKKEKMSYFNSKKYLEYFTTGYSGNKNFDYLINDKLIYIDPYAKSLFKNKKVYFFLYKDSDPEIVNIIKEFDLKDYEFLSIKDLEIEENSKEYISFSNINEEVFYVLNLIAKKIDEEKINPNKINIICATDTYQFSLETYSKYFNLPLNFSETTSLYSSISAKILINNLSNISELIEDESQFSNDSENYKLIKYLYDFYDLKNDKNIEIDFIQILKSYATKKDEYTNGIRVSSNLSFNEDKYFYLLGAIDSFLPKVYSDNDLISDLVKEKTNLTTSVINNEYSFSITLAFLKFNNLLYISYPFNNGSNNIAFILSNNGFRATERKLILDNYSKKISELFFNHYEYRFSKYAEVNDKYPLFKNSFKLVPYYDNKFKAFDTKIEKPNISYSSINDYVTCPFKYYLNHVLRIGNFEETTSIKFGHFAHEIFEHVYEPNFDFNLAVEAIKKEYVFTVKEEYLLIPFLREMAPVCNKIVEQNEAKPITNTFAEYSIEKELPTYKINGRIDRINVYDDSIAIIDYKTGSNFGFNYEQYINFGLDAQFPTYLYLISLDDKLKDKKIIGTFYQPIKTKKSTLYNYVKKTQTYFDSKKMQGLINGDMSIFSKFDPSYPLNKKSLYVDKASFKNDGTMSTRAKCIYSSDQFKEIIKATEELYKKTALSISNGDFAIAPYKLKKQDGCQYCPYINICYRKASDYRILEIEEENKEQGDSTNGME